MALHNSDMNNCAFRQWVRDCWLAGIELDEIRAAIMGNPASTPFDTGLATGYFRSLERRMAKFVPAYN